MAQGARQSSLFAAEDFSVVYESFSEANFQAYDFETIRNSMVEYINNNLPMNAKIFTMFLGRRGYYLDRDYKNESSFGMVTIRHMVDSSDNGKKFLEYIRSMNVTHILMRGDLVENYLQDNFSKKEVNRFLKLVQKYWKKDYENYGYIVWDIQNRR